MKPAYSLIICFLFSLSINTIAKSPIVKVEIANTLKDFYVINLSPIQFKITRENKAEIYTKSIYAGSFNWSKIKVTSKEAIVKNGYLRIIREELIKADFIITLDIELIDRKDTFRQSVQHKLPAIQNITIESHEIVPYTDYTKTIIVRTTDNNYTLDHRNANKGINFFGFEWEFSGNVIQKEHSFQFLPVQGEHTESILLTLQNAALGYKKEYNLLVQPLKQLKLDFSTKKGISGQNGENGESGSTGENGGHGAGAWHGADGTEGANLEILVTKTANSQLKIAVFIDNKVETYLTPIHSTVQIKALGSTGGRGGKGGKGGSGGSGNDEYEAGSDGSGGPGGNGGDGGLGGHITIFSDIEIEQLAYIFGLDVTGGLPGSGGSGGSGYPSGNGGKSGKAGKKGIIEYTLLSSGEINDMMRKLVNK